MCEMGASELHNKILLAVIQRQQQPDIATATQLSQERQARNGWPTGMQYHLSRAHSESFLAMKVPIMLCGILVKRVLLVVFMFISIISRTWVAIWAQSK